MQIVKNHINIDEIKRMAHNGNGICEVDLFLLMESIKFFGAKNIIEIGAGTSTLFLNNIDGIKVKTFANEIIC